MTRPGNLNRMNQTSVLVVSATAGTGHLRAGGAVVNAARVDRPDWHVEHVDVLSLAPRWVKTVYGGGFELVAARAPRVWRGAYALADGPDPDQARWAGIARRVLFRAFERLITTRRWDHVICTHFLPAQLAAGRITGPAFTMVITDFDLHRFWVQPRVHHYCVATERLRDELRNRLPRIQASCTGIPIDPSFRHLPASNTAKRQFGLDPERPVVAVMGGGVGIGVSATARTLLNVLPPEAQLLVLCGRNSEILAQLRALEIDGTRMKCLGYRSDMPVVYAASDVVVSKPGGLTCSEALAVGKPLVLTHPVPGHEEANARLLTSAGVALVAHTPAELAAQTHRLLSDQAILEAMRRATMSMARPDAARSVVAQVAARISADVAA